MQKYMENSTCSGHHSEPTLHDKFKGPASKRTRSLEIGRAEPEILRGRAVDCTLDNWVRILTYAVLLFSVKRKEMDPLKNVWNDEFAASYETDLEYTGLRDFMDRFPNYEPRSVLEYVLYNPQVAGRGIRTASAALETASSTNQELDELLPHIQPIPKQA
ncbi:hypothetical protein GCM10017559_53590 [Streptosporangium longisporum]|uniref:Uncharacterized protein n=1 Tax=Streptosporangium longisporum TaxID=46187 RepID=A0ABP6KR14_9ACTN